MTDLGRFPILGSMGEPARKLSRGEIEGRDSEIPDDELSDVSLLERWVERPDGTFEQVLRPLTPEDYLNPQMGDKWLQGRAHSDFVTDLPPLLRHHFRSRPDVVVTHDLQHRFGPRFPKPCPDVSIAKGVRDRNLIDTYFDVSEVGVLPCLLIEVISPKDKRIRRVDEEDKWELYQEIGIPEYILMLPPQVGRREQGFQIWGYRLGRKGTYEPLQPDEKGRLLSETTGLLFGISPSGDRLEVFDARTGEQLLDLDEQEDARKAAEVRAEAAERKAAREEKGRKAAEAELVRLRAELERRSSSSGR